MFKRVLAVLLVVLSFGFTACKKDSGDKIIGINFGDQIQETYYLGETFITEGKTMTIVYRSGRTEVKNLSEAEIEGADFSTLGKKTIRITYGGFTAKIEVEVINAYPILGSFDGSLIEFYFGEEHDYSNDFISMLYSDGKTRNISLEECNVGTINFMVDGVVRQTTVGYMNVNVTISYKVVYHPIELDFEYRYIWGEVESTAKIVEREGKYFLCIIEQLEDGTQRNINERELEKEEFGSYTYDVFDGERVTHRLYLRNNVLYDNVKV